jgi:hypothetical protein
MRVGRSFPYLMRVTIPVCCKCSAAHFASYTHIRVQITFSGLERSIPTM